MPHPRHAPPAPARHGRPGATLAPRRRALAFVSLLLTALLLFALSATARAAPVPFANDDTLEQAREKIAANGYHFTVSENWITRLPKAEREALRSRGRIPTSPAPRTNGLEAAPALPRRDSLPASFDWRNKDGQSYIGPVRNQGGCGACYAFAAAATAEGAYNVATGRTGSNTADFSEQFLAFCLGTNGPYETHFDGCYGADYSYTELYALTKEGITTETTMPYTGKDNESCNLTSPPMVKFKSWGRIDCGDIAAIKNAIMTYGPVDAAVLTTPEFDGYGGGVYQDSQTDCPSSDGYCYNTTTDHAITLVGWDDGDGGTTPGHWILRNSWGASWGESGYMRIAYSAARVSCAVAYLVYEAPTPVAHPAFLPLLLQ